MGRNFSCVLDRISTIDKAINPITGKMAAREARNWCVEYREHTVHLARVFCGEGWRQ
jgi:hypothetical protein